MAACLTLLWCVMLLWSWVVLWYLIPIGWVDILVLQVGSIVVAGVSIAVYSHFCCLRKALTPYCRNPADFFNPFLDVVPIPRQCPEIDIRCKHVAKPTPIASKQSVGFISLLIYCTQDCRKACIVLHGIRHDVSSEYKVTCVTLSLTSAAMATECWSRWLGE